MRLLAIIASVFLVSGCATFDSPQYHGGASAYVGGYYPVYGHPYHYYPSWYWTYYSPYYYPWYFSVWHSPWHYGPYYRWPGYWHGPWYAWHYPGYPYRYGHDYRHGPYDDRDEFPGVANRGSSRIDPEPGLPIYRNVIPNYVPGNLTLVQTRPGTTQVVSPSRSKIQPSRTGPVSSSRAITGSMRTSNISRGSTRSRSYESSPARRQYRDQR